MTVLVIGIIVIVVILIISSIVNKMLFCKLFTQGNVIVSGLRGRGKDVAFCIVVNQRKKDYISNVCYSNSKRYHWIPLDLKPWELGGNVYQDFVNDTVKPYVYPYPDKVDWYVSDAGVYFPAQYATQLCKQYPSSPLFLALSRHVGDCNVHVNVQAQNRVWDKIREQSDIYVRMYKCKKIPFTKIFFLTAYQYERADTAEIGLLPLKKAGHGSKALDRKTNFEIAHGKIRRYKFFAKLPYEFDSRRFRTLMAPKKSEVV